MDHLSDADIERIVERVIERAGEGIADAAAKKALDRVYAEVGKSGIKWLALTMGAVLIGLLMWMGSKGIKLSP